MTHSASGISLHMKSQSRPVGVRYHRIQKRFPLHGMRAASMRGRPARSRLRWLTVQE